ncbi:MAG TPA: glycosyltransferase family 39 protein, partial [Vicinamibacteria bacterium]|nr:glycosyltransferase family 39 protein [Vicinamibacteria bacterium]
ILGGGTLVAALLLRRRLGLVVGKTPLSRVLPALLLLVVTFALDARPSEDLVGGRDPGAYVAAMCVIGRTGGIIYRDPAILSIPEEDRELFFRNPHAPRDFSWARFMGFPLERPETGRVVPEFFHLFPAFGAYLFDAMGVKGALATPPVFGVLGTLAAFFALRRILGAVPAFLGTLLLATNTVMVWFARYPVSETLSLFLIFTGLFALALFEERGSPLLGALAGSAWGLGLLVRIDAVLLLVPLGLYVLFRRGGGRRLLSLILPFGFFCLHAAVHAAFWSRKYLLDIASRSYWRHSRIFWMGLGVLVLLALPLVDRGARAFALGLRGRAPRKALLAALSLLALYAYCLRPSLSAWAGADGNDPSRALIPPRTFERTSDTERSADSDPMHRVRARADSKALLAHLSPLPHLLVRLGFRRLAAHDAQAFYRLGWFVGPLALLLGVLGLLLVIHEWRGGFTFLLLTTLTFSLFYLYKIRVYNDYFFALRRFVPVTLPALFACCGYLLFRMASLGGWRKVASALLALVLLGTNLRGLARGPSPLYRFVDWKGSVGFVRDLAGHFGPRDMVIFEQP